MIDSPALPTGVLAGSPVLTLRGEVPAEEIRPGEMLVGVSGAVAPYAPLQARRIVTHDLGATPWARPLRIRADALEAGQPMADLLVAPGQLLFFEGALVPAWRLADGFGITAEEGLAQAAYVRLALGEHDALLVAGVAVASDPRIRDAGPAQPPCAEPMEEMALGHLLCRIRLQAEAMGWAPPLAAAPEPPRVGTPRARLMASTGRLAPPGPELPACFPKEPGEPA